MVCGVVVVNAWYEGCLMAHSLQITILGLWVLQATTRHTGEMMHKCCFHVT